MIRLAALLWTLLVLLCASGASAQPDSEINFEAWSELAARVERVIELDAAPDQTLDRLRSDVAAYREQFLEAQEAHLLRIQTLERQLQVLAPPSSEPAADPPPEAAENGPEAEALPEDQSELPWAEARRAELEARLQALREPNLRAAEAFAHADGLIRELDAMLRQRKAEVVFTRGPVPLNPLNWALPLTQLETYVAALPKEVIDTVSDADARAELISNLPAVVLLMGFGAFLLVRGRRWTRKLSRAATGIISPALRFPANAVIMLIDIALPWLGLVLLISAALTSQLFGETGEALLQAIRRFGLFAIVWSAFMVRLLPKEDGHLGVTGLEGKQLIRARRAGLALVYTVATAEGVGVFFTQVEADDATTAFFLFPIFLILSFFLYRFSRCFLYPAQSGHGEGEGDGSFPLRLRDIIARLGMLTAVVSPLAAAAGYHGYAVATLEPAANTIFFLGLAAFVVAWLKALYAALRPGRSEDQDLAPTLIGIIVYTALLPLLALTWGARVTDLTEVWASIQEGFALGGVTVSPVDIATFLLVFAILYGLTRLLQAALRVSILPKTRLDIGSRTAIVSGIGYLGVFLAAVVSIQSTGLDLSSLAIVAGALSVGIGFGLQNIVSNFVSGIILLIERPISEGDWIDVGGQQGYVRAISVRSTRIETFDRTDVIVPNSDLVSGTVTNWTRGNLVGRVIVPVGVAYGTDPARVERILREIAEDHPMVLIAPPPAVLFMNFGADALEFEIRAILRDVNFSLSVKSDLNHAIARRFAEEGIEIPFAQRDIWLRNAEVLTGRPAGPEVPRPDLETRTALPQRDEVLEGPDPGDAGDGDAR